jgi:hypothetical protein
LFQYQGCYYHQHLDCMNYKKDHGKQQIGALRAASTQARTDLLRRLGYTVHEIWECEANKQLKANPALMAKIMRSLVMVESPLVASDALYGGRTETIRLLCDGRMTYKDVVSEYPFTMKYTRYIYYKFKCLKTK